jgi:hypothetical protein
MVTKTNSIVSSLALAAMLPTNVAVPNDLTLSLASATMGKAVAARSLTNSERKLILCELLQGRAGIQFRTADGKDGLAYAWRWEERERPTVLALFFLKAGRNGTDVMITYSAEGEFQKFELGQLGWVIQKDHSRGGQRTRARKFTPTGSKSDEYGPESNWARQQADSFLIRFRDAPNSNKRVVCSQSNNSGR